MRLQPSPHKVLLLMFDCFVFADPFRFQFTAFQPTTIFLHHIQPTTEPPYSFSTEDSLKKKSSLQTYNNE